MNTEARYVFNDAVRMFPSESSGMTMCEAPDGHGNCARFVAPIQLVELFRMFDGSRTSADVFRLYSQRHGHEAWTPEKLESLIAAFCLPKRILIDPLAQPMEKRPQSSSHLYVRKTLLSGTVVSRIAKSLRWSFAPRYASVLALTVSTGHLWLYLFAQRVHSINLALAGGRDLTVAMLFAIFAALIHEFGHATAQAYYGAYGATVGIGIYVYLPVLYTDVSETWRLKRLQRAVVDLGGVYFQSVAATVAILLFCLTHAMLWLYTALLIDFSIAFALNPFLKMDGYWLVADLFGIWNLRSTSLSMLQAVKDRIAGAAERQPPQAMRLRPSAAWMLAAYAAASVGFFIYLAQIVVRQVVFILLPNYPHMVKIGIHAIVSHPTDPLVLAATLLELFWKTAVLLGCAIAAWRVLNKSYRHIQHWTRGSDSSIAVGKRSSAV